MDAVRGAAILLMVLDHVLVQVDPVSFLRVGSPFAVTRLSLPLFMLAAGWVWQPADPFDRRRWRLVPVALVEAALYAYLDMPRPGIVLVFLMVVCVCDAVAAVAQRRNPWGGPSELHPYVLAVVGLVQALYVPIGWDGYEPGLVLCWFALGRCAFWMPQWAPESVRVPGWLVWVGRHPIVWYLGHLVAIAGAVTLL